MSFANVQSDSGSIQDSMSSSNNRIKEIHDDYVGGTQVTETDMAEVKETVIDDNYSIKKSNTLFENITVIYYDSSEIVVNMTLDDAVNNLLIYNSELIRARLEWFSTCEKYRASFGNFEPSFFANYKNETTERPAAMFEQLQNTYTTGIEGFLPSATKYSFNFTLTDYQYKFSDNTSKPSVFTGVSLTQPLLQGLWFGKPILDNKVARIEKEIALQKYRSALTTKLLELMNMYWKLRYMQEKVKFATKSVAIVDEIVRDSKQLLNAGKISSLDAVEALSELATRQSALSDSKKEMISSANEFKLLIAGKNFLKDTSVFASSELVVTTDSGVDYNKKLVPGYDSIQPDFLQRKFELKKSYLARDYQYNQCLPELNVKSTLGIITSASRTNIAWDRFTDKEIRKKSGTFSIELDFRIPLGLNIKERHMLASENANVKSAENNMTTIQLQIENYFSVAIKRLNSIKNNLMNVDIVLNYRETMLNAEIIRQKAGKSNYRKIFEIEEELTKSKIWYLENILDFKSTNNELSRLSGTTLSEMKLESIKDGQFILIENLIKIK
jgi:outer membrane protein TolC